MHCVHVTPSGHGQDVKVIFGLICLQGKQIPHVAIGSVRHARAVIVPKYPVIGLGPGKDQGQLTEEVLRMWVTGAERANRAHDVQVHQHVFAHSFTPRGWEA